MFPHPKTSHVRVSPSVSRFTTNRNLKQTFSLFSFFAASARYLLALIFGGLTVGIVAGENLEEVLDSFKDGFGSTAAGVGILIALGAMFAKLLAAVIETESKFNANAHSAAGAVGLVRPSPGTRSHRS